MDQQEAQYRRQLEEFPTSALPHFALGRYLLERGRYEEAVGSLEEANRLQPEYAAGLLTLGDAYRGAGHVDKARATFVVARRVALAQHHPSLAEEIDDRLASL
jgi:cytochrome c-type biogenesis protein CcmH/NrfG